MEDIKIIELFNERQERAISEVEKKYGRLCHRIAGNILKNHSDTEECVNDTYFGLWNSIPPAKPKNLMAYVAKVVRNHSLKRLEYNGAAKRSSCEPVEFSELEEVLADENIRDGIDERELGGHISTFLRQESEDSRNVFIRKYWYFDSIEEISRRYKFSNSKVKSMLFQTRNRLKSYLKSKGVQI